MREASEPRLVGAAVALGALVGVSPLVGLQTIVAIALATLFRLNRLATLIGANVSFGPLVAVWAGAELAVGSRITGRPLVGVASSPWHTSRDALVSWFAGFAIVGPLIAVSFGLVAYLVACRRPHS